MQEEVNQLFYAENRIGDLKRRVARCCCKYCGKPLVLRQLIFHEVEDVRLEIYCNHCGKIEYGVEPEIYRSAEHFVNSTDYNYFPELEDGIKRKQLNIAKVCEILTCGCLDMGILHQEGFSVPVEVLARNLDGCIIFKSSEITMEEGENDV